MFFVNTFFNHFFILYISNRYSNFSTTKIQKYAIQTRRLSKKFTFSNWLSANTVYCQSQIPSYKECRRRISNKSETMNNQERAYVIATNHIQLRKEAWSQGPHGRTQNLRLLLLYPFNVWCHYQFPVNIIFQSLYTQD